MNLFRFFPLRFSPLAKQRHFIKRIKKMNIMLIEKNQKIPLKIKELKKIENLNLNINGSWDTTNLIEIELPQQKNLNIRISFQGKNNKVFIGKNCAGFFDIVLSDSGNTCIIGKETECCSAFITLFGNILKIGENCMFSNNIRIWGDGHSVLKYPSKEVLNLPIKEIQIGNHSWLGERVTLTKNAQIPRDSIVGIASVVTKTFEREHCVIAGNPAKIVKEGVTWDEKSPLRYVQDQKIGEGEENQ